MRTYTVTATVIVLALTWSHEAKAQAVPAPTGAAHLFTSSLPGVTATDMCIVGTVVLCETGMAPDVFTGISTSGVITDPVGNLYSRESTVAYIGECTSDNSNIPLHESSLQRVSVSGTLETIGAFRDHCTSGNGLIYREVVNVSQVVAMDPVNGVLFVKVIRRNDRGCCTGGGQVQSYVRISGLANLMDVLLTFVPGSQALAITTPTFPDGFRTADSLQVWTGDVRSMPDWSQAEPLTCEAVASPIPGQLVSVADTLPDPTVGEGRYYLVASQNGVDRRLGRQYLNGAFSARQPSGLPACQ